jgi:hypothetical protein
MRPYRYHGDADETQTAAAGDLSAFLLMAAAPLGCLAPVPCPVPPPKVTTEPTIFEFCGSCRREPAPLSAMAPYVESSNWARSKRWPSIKTVAGRIAAALIAGAPANPSSLRR